MTEDSTEKTYLLELSQQTDANPENHISMYTVGQTLGLEKNQSSTIAENLMMQGLVELKTLAGEISITPEGLSALGLSLKPSSIGETGKQLSSNLVSSSDDLKLIETLVGAIRKTTIEHEISFILLEAIIIDVKTLEIQCLSPKPKNTIVKEILQSLTSSLNEAGIKEIAREVQHCSGQ